MPFSKSLVKTILFTTAITLGVTACNLNQKEKEVTYTPGKIYKLTVLYTSGFVDESSPSYIQASRDAKSELIHAIRDELKASNGHLILLSGGTESPESPAALSSHLDTLNYDALVVNSYMFNQPMPYIRKLEKSSSAPFISANLFESETGKPLFDAFTLVSADDLNIAIVGITSNEIKEKHRKHLSGFDIINSASMGLLEKLKMQSDIVIAATHSGHLPKASFSASYPGVDLVVGDHQHDQNAPPFSTLNCDEWVTRIDLEFINGQTNVIRQEKLMILNQQVSALEI